MKTQNNFALPVFLILPVFAIFMIVCSSCGKENNTALKVHESIIPPPPDAPPPPPPPPYFLNNSDTVWVQVDQMPLFSGGDAALLKYVSENIVYPASAKTNGIQGKVLVSFIVGKDGRVSDIKIEKGVNPDIDAESLRVISSLPRFEKAGTKNGRAVPVLFMLPISFALK